MKKSKEKVSVIIPVYNGKEFIKETLLSVKNQDYSNIEVIIIDDNSDDGSYEFIKNLDIGLSFDLYRNEKNRGISRTRNRGVKKAKGEYICILDQDDIWKKNKVSKQVEFLENNKSVGIVYSSKEIIDENNNHVENQISRGNYMDKSAEKIATYFYNSFEREDNPFRPFPGGMIRKKVFDEIGYYDESLYGNNDRDLLLRAVKDFNIGLIEEPLLKKRTHSKNAGKLAPKQIIQDKFILTEKLVNMYPHLNKYYMKRISILNLMRGKIEFKQKNFKKSLKHILAGISFAPIYAFKTILKKKFIDNESKVFFQEILYKGRDFKLCFFFHFYD